MAPPLRSSQRPQALQKVRPSPAALEAPLPGGRVPGRAGCLVLLPGCGRGQSPSRQFREPTPRTVEKEPLGGQGPRRRTSRVQLCCFPQTTPPCAGGSPLSLRTAPESTAPLTPCMPPGLTPAPPWRLQGREIQLLPPQDSCAERVGVARSTECGEEPCQPGSRPAGKRRREWGLTLTSANSNPVPGGRKH